MRAPLQEALSGRGLGVILPSTAETRGTFGGGEHLPSCFGIPNLGEWKILQNVALASEGHSFLTVAGAMLFSWTVVNY